MQRVTFWSPFRVQGLHTPSPPATESEMQLTPFGLHTVTSSPLDAETLRCINPVLNRLVATQEPSHTLARKYVNRLTDISERLRGRVAILESENTTLKNTIWVRKECKKGKQFVLQGKILLTKTELYSAILDCEKETKSRKKKQLKKQRAPSVAIETESENDREGSESQRANLGDMEDCIVAADR